MNSERGSETSKANRKPPTKDKNSPAKRKQGLQVNVHRQFKDRIYNQQVKNTSAFQIDKNDRIGDPYVEEFTRDEDTSYMNVPSQRNVPLIKPLKTTST